MQKSMVHELNNLASSQFLTNRSTFISTAFNDGDYQLRKSRIQNLPSYRKEDLSGRVNFVVVFQAIEIERLSNEVEALRIALKDQQRQTFNIKSYEVQIRQLTQRCFSYEGEREEYRQQIDKLNMICQKLYEELESMRVRFQGLDPSIREKYRIEKDRTKSLEQEMEKWKVRYSALETSKNREMEDMKLMMENQRKSIIDRQIKELTLKFNMDRQSMQKQVRKLRQALQRKQSQQTRLSTRISQLEILNQELHQYERTIDDYENKFAMISQETMRLNDVLRRKQEEIDRLVSIEGGYKRKIGEMERKMGELEEGGGEKARMLEVQVRDWRSKYSRLEDENKDYKRQLSQIPQFKQAIQQINIESERLRDAVRQKMGQIDDWKGKYQKIDAEFRENKAKQQQKIPLLENKVHQLNTQNDRLNNTLKSRTVEIQGWKQKIGEIEKQLARYAILEQNKKELENQVNGQIRQITELQGNIRQLQGQAKRVGQIEKQLGRERTEKQEMKKQMFRLNNVIKGTSQKAENMERRCMNLQRQLKNFTDMKEEIRIYKQKEINMTKEIDRINGIIVEKIRQIQALKQVFQRFESKLTQYQGLQKKLVQSVSQTQKLITDLDQSRKQATMLQDKLIAYESESKKLRNDVFSLNQEREQLTRLISSKTQELQVSQAEVVQLQGQVTRLNSFQARFIELQEKYKSMEIKLNDTTKRLKNQQSKSMQYSQKLEQTTSQLLKIKRQGSLSPKFKQEYTELIRQNMQRDKQIKMLQNRINVIEGLLRKLKEVTVRQDGISKKNTERLLSIGQRFDISTQAYKKMFQLQSQNLKLNEQNMQLQSKVRVINVQNETLKLSRGVVTPNNIGLALPAYNGVREKEGPKSPIDMLATKRSQVVGSQYGSPMYNKSSSVGNIAGGGMAVANTGGFAKNINTSSPTNFAYKNKNQSTNNYDFTYTQSIIKPASPAPMPKSPSNNYNNYNYTYHSVQDPNQEPTENSYAYNYNYTTSISSANGPSADGMRTGKANFSIPLAENSALSYGNNINSNSNSNTSSRQRSNANFNQNINTYNYSYQITNTNNPNTNINIMEANFDRKKHEQQIDAIMDIGNNGGRIERITNTNANINSYETNGSGSARVIGGGAMGIGMAVEDNTNTTNGAGYMNYEAFSKRPSPHTQSSQAIGVKPAVVPFQFKTSTTKYYQY